MSLPEILGAPVQIAYAVPDAFEAARRWVDLGAGPFFVREHIPVAEVLLYGEPAEFDHTSAYGQWGAVMVELVQDHGSGPSVVREMFAPGESGLHHLAFFVDDLDVATAALAAAGYPLAMSAVAGSGTRFHFFDARASLGHMLEIYTGTDHLRRFYSMVAGAASEWNGADPVRRA